MTLICGTDLSEASIAAVRAAAHLAKRMQTSLHLVHSVELSSEPQFDEPRQQAERWARSQLQTTAAHLAEPRVDVQVHIVSTPPDEALEDIATQFDGKLIIVAALGKRRPGAWLLGSHAERLAHRARLPVLVIRDAGPFEAWVHQKRPLQILLGTDVSNTSRAAMDWVRELASFGPCSVTAAHMYWPPAQFERLGLSGVRSQIDPDPVVTATLERELNAELARGLGDVPFKLHLEPYVGGVGTRLAALAAEQKADLVVVGTHGRSGIDPLLLGTISHSVAHGATMSVACIPAPAAVATAAPRAVRTALVATDFSVTGNAAVGMACATLPPDGTLHLVHVVPERGRDGIEPRDVFAGQGDSQSPIGKELLALVSANSKRGLSVHAHVLVASDVSVAICQAAERLGADLICVGTHGRSGLSKLLLGSVAQAIVGGTKRPVLLVRPPETVA